MRKDITKLCRELARAGWVVSRCGSGHYKAKHDHLGMTITFSVTPSCPFALKNIKGDIKRAMKQSKGK